MFEQKSNILGDPNYYSNWNRIYCVISQSHENFSFTSSNHAIIYDWMTMMSNKMTKINHTSLVIDQNILCFVFVVKKLDISEEK